MAKKTNPYSVSVSVDSTRKTSKNKRGKTKSSITERSSSTYGDGSSVSQNSRQTTNKRGKSKTYNRVLVRDSKGKKTATQVTRNGKIKKR